MVAPEGNDPSSKAFQTSANPSQLKCIKIGGTGQNLTGVSGVASQRIYPLLPCRGSTLFSFPFESGRICGLRHMIGSRSRIRTSFLLTQNQLHIHMCLTAIVWQGRLDSNQFSEFQRLVRNSVHDPIVWSRWHESNVRLRYPRPVLIPSATSSSFSVSVIVQHGN
jgi:hypothetical protein